jgi:hypothetical protein
MSAMQELEPADRAELTKLVNAVALSDRSLSLFAIAPDSAPNHPVLEHYPFGVADWQYSSISIANIEKTSPTTTSPSASSLANSCVTSPPTIPPNPAESSMSIVSLLTKIMHSAQRNRVLLDVQAATKYFHKNPVSGLSS